MVIKTQLVFERESGDCTANVTGVVQKHFGRLEVRDLDSDLILTKDEREIACEKLCERAAQEGFLPEVEPDAKRRN